MAGPACKIIINNMVAAVARSLEQVLTSPLVRGPMLSPAECDGLLQELVNNDLHSYNGPGRGALAASAGKAGPLPPGLCRIVEKLERHGVFTAEVWQILRHPRNPAVPAGD